MKPTLKNEPLQYYFPELNSLQINKLRRMILAFVQEEVDAAVTEALAKDQAYIRYLKQKKGKS